MNSGPARHDQRDAMSAEMTTVAHVMDRTCTPGTLLELALLAGPDAKCLCIGPAPDPAQLPARSRPSSPPTCVTLSELRYDGRRHLAPLLGESAICQCWSIGSARAVHEALSQRPIPIVLRLARMPAGNELARLLDLTEVGPLTVVCPTERMGERLRRVGPSAAVEVIPPPAEIAEDLRARRRALRERLGLDPGQVAIVAPGQVHRLSGHRQAVWAAAILTVAELPVRLIVQHAGPGARAVAAFSREAGFERLTILADLPVPDVLAAADVVALVGLDALPPVVTAAAMGAGLPIVASDVPPAGAWLGETNAAVLVPPDRPRAVARAILRLIEDSALARRLGAAARSAASGKFAVESIRRRWEDLHSAVRRSHRAQAAAPSG